VVTLVQRHDEVDRAAVAAAFTALEERARVSLRAQGVPDAGMAMVRSVDARYLGEAHEIAVPVAGEFDVARAVEAFHDAHERLYGYAYRGGAGPSPRTTSAGVPAQSTDSVGQVTEFVNWKITGLGAIQRPSLEFSRPSGSGRPTGERAGFTVYRRSDLPEGSIGRGPAIIEEYGSTTVVEAGFAIEVDRLGNLVLRAD
jgi:N-methylhydantoinase A